VTREKEMNINYTKKSFTCSNKFGGYVPSWREGTMYKDLWKYKE
jgi:hypothetical protein